MIIECEKCSSKFHFDENLIKEEGSKVRCSVCKEVFMAYSPEPTPSEAEPSTPALEEDLEETVALDSPPLIDEEEAAPSEGDLGADLDQVFDEIEEGEAIETISPDEIPGEEEQETVDMDEVFDQATQIEEEVTKADADKKETEHPEEEEEQEESPAAAPKRKKGGLSRVLIIVLVILLVFIGCAAAIFYLAPDLIPSSLSILKPTKKQEMTDRGVSRLAFKDVSGSFISTEVAPLFVIKGSVTSNYPQARRFILIKGSILDEKGQVLKGQLVYAGNSFSEKQLKEMTLEQLYAGLKNRSGKGGMNANIKPGTSIPFMIVFDNLQESMSEFTVEAVSSSLVN
ncbi:DUF3426 domain-containing protein [Thermodesulfobacteriota bacterium]